MSQYSTTNRVQPGLPLRRSIGRLASSPAENVFNRICFSGALAVPASLAMSCSMICYTFDELELCRPRHKHSHAGQLLNLSHSSFLQSRPDSLFFAFHFVTSQITPKALAQLALSLILFKTCLLRDYGLDSWPNAAFRLRSPSPRRHRTCFNSDARYDAK